MRAPSSGMALDLLPIGVGQVDVALQDPVREHELADVVEEPGGVHNILFLVGKPRNPCDLARVAGDAGAVAGRHAVAQVERAKERGKQRDLEAGELAVSELELVGTLL
jgi:hypothetical protein